MSKIDPYIEQIIHYCDQRVGMSFGDLIQEKLTDMEQSFYPEGEWMVSPPVNGKMPLLMGQNMSNMAIIQPRIDAATAIRDEELLNPQYFQFIDPTGRERVEEGRIAITGSVMNGLLKMGGGPMGLSADAAAEHDPLDTLRPNPGKVFVMRLTQEEYAKLPVYIVATALMERAADIMVVNKGDLLEGKNFEEYFMGLAKGIADIVKTDEVAQKSIEQYCPDEASRTHMFKAIVRLMEHQAKDVKLDAEFARHKSEIERLILGQEPGVGRC